MVAYFEDSRELNSKELKQAEILWIRTVQADSFLSESSYLKKLQQATPRRIQQFQLFLDEDKILRCCGRLNNASFPVETKNPILMPIKNPIVDLLIGDTRQTVKHSSVDSTLTALRERFWILRGRQAVKQVLRRCIICKKLDGLSYPTCNSPDLLRIRVAQDPPFTHVGIAFAGPSFAQPSSSSESRNEKCYVCLFTSASTRAVHLELTRNLTVDSFLLAFTSRRGLPATLITDNAKTFRGASKEFVKKFEIEGSYAVCDKHENPMEIHSGKGSMVGWVLGASDTECQEVFRENHLEFR